MVGTTKLQRRTTMLGTDAEHLSREMDSAVDCESSCGGLVQDCREDCSSQEQTATLLHHGDALPSSLSDADQQEIKESNQVNVKIAIQTALDAGWKGGVAGAAAMGVNVLALMWIRTTLIYQYRHGTSFPTALRTLYRDGGIPRFYRGLVPSLLYAPLLRFTDTASNTGMLTLLEQWDSTRHLSTGFKTVGASTVASMFRILLMPIDTIKINMQVNGNFQSIVTKIKSDGTFAALYRGSVSAAASTFVGHYPWYFTYIYLNDNISPKPVGSWEELQRRAFIGFSASIVSDTASNSIRVVKVYKQSHAEALSYPVVVKRVIQESGLFGLMFRGLETKIVANGLQGILFTVMWKHFEDILMNKR